MEMERFDGKATEQDQEALALVLNLARAFERATHFSFPRKILRVLCEYFGASEASAVRRMCGGAAPDQNGHFARVKVEFACFYVLCCRMH